MTFIQDVSVSEEREGFSIQDAAEDFTSNDVYTHSTGVIRVKLWNNSE